jgi:Asp-tRNA(Asn)/Glu-tRNA(Gln) amidotransferase A subunit family amidase
MLLAGETTPREIVESVASAISAQNETIGGYLSSDFEKALVDAEAADLAKPLGGIPIALKDNIKIKKTRKIPNTASIFKKRRR